MAHKSGFVTIIGRPNVGKSTLLNRIAGEKIAITSPRPQTTRTNLRAVITEKDYQMIFIDTPGLHEPRTKLGTYMTQSAGNTITQADAIVFICDATARSVSTADAKVTEMLRKATCPVFLALNKTDAVPKESLLERISVLSSMMEYADIIPLSAKTGDGVEILMDLLIKAMPEGPSYFPEDIVTDTPIRDLCAELIREKVLRYTSDEVPHGVGVEIVRFDESPRDLTVIHANIYCEKSSHKAILIGKNGDMLKRIGTSARRDIEKLVGSKTHLQLWVKVKPDWRNNRGVLKELGYE